MTSEQTLADFGVTDTDVKNVVVTTCCYRPSVINRTQVFPERVERTFSPTLFEATSQAQDLSLAMKEIFEQVSDIIRAHRDIGQFLDHIVLNFELAEDQLTPINHLLRQSTGCPLIFGDGVSMSFYVYGARL